MNLYENLLEKLGGTAYSNYFTILCPYHDDHKPSCFVYEDGFYCRTCGKKGSLKFLDSSTGSHFSPRRVDTVSNILPQWRSWGDSLDEIAERAHKTLKHYKQFQGYLKKRKCEEYIEKGFLGYRDGWLVIPVFDRNRKIVDIVARAVKGKQDTRYVVKPSENARPLFCPNWSIVEKSERIYVVYGIFDAISLDLIGLPVVTGITGKSLSAESLQPLGKRFTIIPDEHEEKDAHNLANKLGWKARVKELDYPIFTKDVDEIRRKYGNAWLQKMLEM